MESWNSAKQLFGLIIKDYDRSELDKAIFKCYFFAKLNAHYI